MEVHTGERGHHPITEDAVEGLDLDARERLGHARGDHDVVAREELGEALGEAHLVVERARRETEERLLDALAS